MSSVFVIIMVTASLLVLFILPKIEGNAGKYDVSTNWQSVWKERLKIDN
ncbi:MAG: hypothetical protein N3F66_06680 [Spirochaetes bacterium]|nr:hypothetical protein [Spirochaetota bacterium]